MLKGIPSVISPELMKIMMEMGHSDELVIADRNFPAATYARRLIRCDGHNVSDILNAILIFFPLDHFVSKPVSLMDVIPGDKTNPGIWEKYKSIILNYESDFFEFDLVERYDFYQRAKNAYAIIATSEKEPYANIILKKGHILD